MQSDEVRSLCDWFLTVDRTILPDAPFRLTNHQTVTGAGFYDVLTREAMDAIAHLDGERINPPIRLPGLMRDLQALKSLSFAQIDDDDIDW